MHKLLVSLPQTPSLVFRRYLLSLSYISYKLTALRPVYTFGTFPVNCRCPTVVGAAAQLYVSLDSQCAVKGVLFPAGANPARQLSLQPEALEAVQGGNELD